MDNDWGIAMNTIDIKNRTEYNNLVSNAFKQKIKEENQKEAKRLLYVALTRPKNYLTIIGTLKSCEIKSQQTNFEIANSKSYLEWILGCFTDNELNIFDTKSQYVKKLANSNIYLDKLNCDDIKEIDVKEEKQSEKIKVNKKQFFEILSHEFEDNNLAKKNSVSQIMSEEEHYNISNFNYLKSDRENDEDFLAIGTAYHKYMELLDFSGDEKILNEQIARLKEQNKIDADMSTLVDENKIITAIKNISSLISSKDVVLKEQQFLTYMPANLLIKTNLTNKILVQGVADLIVIKDSEIYLFDYKTSRLKSEDQFVEKYRTQLDIYAKSIEGFYGKPVTKKFIYSFHLDKLIII